MTANALQASVLPATVDHASANACVAMLSAEIARSTNSANRVMAVDISAVQHFDSSALAVLLQARREALSVGKTLQVTGWPQPLERLARLYGVHELFAV